MNGVFQLIMSGVVTGIFVLLLVFLWQRVRPGMNAA